MSVQVIEWAMATDLLPNPDEFAKDMGIWSLALILPQVTQHTHTHTNTHTKQTRTRTHTHTHTQNKHAHTRNTHQKQPLTNIDVFKSYVTCRINDVMCGVLCLVWASLSLSLSISLSLSLSLCVCVCVCVCVCSCCVHVLRS